MKPLTFDALPDVVRREILQHLPLDDVLSLINASPAMYRTALGSQRVVSWSFVNMEIEEGLVPLAIAFDKAQNTTWKPDQSLDPETSGAAYTRKVVAFVDKHLKDHRTIVMPEDMNLEMGIRIVNAHRIIVWLAEYLAVEVGKHLESSRTATEWLRIQKSVYIHELSIIACWQVVPDGKNDNTAWCAFWRSFAPWEAAAMKPLEAAICRLLGKGYLWRSIRSEIMATVGESIGDLLTEPYALVPWKPVYKHLPHWSAKRLYAFINNTPDAHKFLQDTGALLNEKDVPLVKLDICRHITENRCMWYPSGRDRTLREILQVAQSYGDGHEGPRELFLWSQLFNMVDAASPLQRFKDSWRAVLSYSFDDNNGRVAFPGRSCAFVMRRLFRDLRIPEGRSLNPVLPDMDQLVAEAIRQIHKEEVAAQVAQTQAMLAQAQV